MNIFAIADLHLSEAVNKPMDIFGDVWKNHKEQIIINWEKSVDKNDVVLIPGDISWAMALEEARLDLDLISSLPGTKILIKGNHDYWWKSITKLNSLFENMIFIQNNSIKVGDYTICGTRGWAYIEDDIDLDRNKKIYEREVKRLELSLEDAVNKGATNIIVMLHYPPTNEGEKDSAFTKLISKYPVTNVVYGHLHGREYFENSIQGEYNGIKYELVSSDYISFCPRKII